MDTNPYGNILKALGKEDPHQGGLTYEQQSANYSAFSQMMKDGVYIPDLLKRIETLEDQVKEQAVKKDTLDADLFSVMEQAVKGDPDVKKARQRLAEEKTRVITDLCMRDEGYRGAMESYRRAVNAAYVHTRETSLNPD